MASTNFIDALIPGLRTEKAEILWLEGKDYTCACHYQNSNTRCQTVDLMNEESAPVHHYHRFLMAASAPVWSPSPESCPLPRHKLINGDTLDELSHCACEQGSHCRTGISSFDLSGQLIP
jgi:hypothetical protein